MANSRAAAPKGAQKRELLAYWMTGALFVLVPKRRGAGFLRVPLGHHYNADMAALGEIAGCDIYGLDGALEFHCGTGISTFEPERAAFLSRVEPRLITIYDCPLRMASHSEFWANHPVGNAGGAQA